MRKEDIRDSLGISLATVNNWIKTATIPSPDQGERYSVETFHRIVSLIRSRSDKLNGRANRSQAEGRLVSFLGIRDKERKQLLLKVIEVYEESRVSIREGVIALCIKMLKDNGLFFPESVIFNKITSWIGELNRKLEEFDLFQDLRITNLDDDFIGAFYQSIQSISERSDKGSYYTPGELLSSIKVEKDRKVIDPCCGSGGVLLRVLSENHDPTLISARDIDEIALQICEVNLVMFFNNPNIAPDICRKDLVFQDSNDLFSTPIIDHFDCIVTNPPWGSKFTKTQKDMLLRSYPKLLTAESYSIALYQALGMLSKTGELFFFLPHSFLNVASHRNIRREILNSSSRIRIKLLGNAFKGVLSEAVLINVKLETTAQDIDIIEVEDKKGNVYSIRKSQVSAPDYIIPATSSGLDDEILNKIESTEHSTLADNGDFALGIVTGNNKAHVQSKKTSRSEPIFRGKDIVSYKCTDPECFIEFQPELYQQVAPIKFFRTKKVVYRFISDRIICALDEDNSLVLNSANLFISRNYPMETIVCLFNSCIYTFIYRKRFHSTKVLKSHLQSLPLPNLSRDQHMKFEALYRDILIGKVGQREIDQELLHIFKLSLGEYEYIKENTSGNS